MHKWEDHGGGAHREECERDTGYPPRSVQRLSREWTASFTVTTRHRAWSWVPTQQNRGTGPNLLRTLASGLRPALYT